MQQPMQNPKYISDPTTAFDMALELMSKAFQLNNTTPINNNQRSSSNPCYSQIVVQNAVQNQGNQNVGNQNGLSVISRIANQHGNGNVIAAQAEGNGAYEVIERVNANCTLKDNMQQASTSGTQTDKAPVYDSEDQLSSGKQITNLNEEISNLNKQLSKEKSIVSSLLEEKKKLKSDLKIREDELLDKQILLENKIKESDNILVKMGQSIQTMHMLSPKPDSFYHTEQKMALGYQNPFYLKQAQQKQQIQAQGFGIGIERLLQSNWNNPKSDKVLFKSKSSCLSNKLEKIEENHRGLQSSNYPDHTSSECNNIKLAIQNEKSEVICATCKQCHNTANHDDCVLQYVNGMKSRKKNQSANVSKSANQRKHKPRVWKPKKEGSKERLALPKPSTPRSCLSWSPTGRMFDLKGKIIATSESEYQPDCSKGDNACTSNPQEPINKRFSSLTFSMTCCQNWLDTLLIPLLSEYKPKDKENHGDNE
ncbi:hypothetical protein Tco_0438126 [Tanacetum coccineum]